MDRKKDRKKSGRHWRSCHARHELLQCSLTMVFVDKQDLLDGALLEAHFVELSQETQELGRLQTGQWFIHHQTQRNPVPVVLPAHCDEHSEVKESEATRWTELTLLSQFWNISRASSTWASSKPSSHRRSRDRRYLRIYEQPHSRFVFILVHFCNTEEKKTF